MKDKMFSKNMAILMGAGLLINILMVYLTGFLQLPLYLDSIGTIIVAVLGGTLPGITVGYFSNIINYAAAISPDPLTLYYGFISVLLAVSVVAMAKMGLFQNISMTIATIFVLAFIGGGLGSILTWMLYGFSFGENVSSPFVMLIYKTLNCQPFVAQLLGDYGIDVLDKGISVFCAWGLIRLIPERMLSGFRYGDYYVRDDVQKNKEEDGLSVKCRKTSLKGKLALIVASASLILGTTATLIGMYIHQKSSLDFYKTTCENVADILVDLVDGDKIDSYLGEGDDTGEYARICEEITSLQKNINDIGMISIFRTDADHNRNIFHQTREGDSLSLESSYIVWPMEIQRYIDLVKSGEGADHYCVTLNHNSSVMAIRTIYSESGDPSAYVIAEMKLDSLKNDLSVYFIRIFSLLFGIGIIIVGYIFWFYENGILKPIKILIMQTKEVSRIKEGDSQLRERMKVETGDELEILFQDMCDAEDSILHSEHASKSKTAFLSKMSHEIRTPLNSVIGFSNLAINEQKTITKEELIDYMHKIQISGNYLLELVSDVLDISRIEEGRMAVNNEACRLDDLVDEVVNSFQGQMKNKNLEFVVDKDYKDVLLYMDNFHTVQILNNLISNAYKYTEEGGVVGLEIHCRQLNKKNMQVQFVVQDTGIGMSEEFQKKIFEPFTQDERGMKMKKQLRGSGLGMSICKNLVELLGGTIKLESTVGEGSCFTVTITYELIGQAKQADTRQDNDYSMLKGKKILVVDDLELNRIVVEKSLAMYGLKFEDAEDGKQAVQKFTESSEGEYFTIFMDVQMPEMNGYEATEAIRALNRKDHLLPIIGMTADAFSDDIKKAKDSGMDYHVTKPIQLQKVLGILMEIEHFQYHDTSSEGK